MPIPDYEEVMLPLLKAFSDGEARRVRDVGRSLVSVFELTDEELEKRIPSGQFTVMESRVGWARTYLKKAGLIEPVNRGVYRISQRGRDVLSANLAKIDQSFLKQFPEFLEFLKPKSDGALGTSEPLPAVESQTPLEILEAAHLRLRRELADEILQALQAASPGFFERLVVSVLVAMGYGGTLKDAGEAVGRSGDDGVDGIIKEDRLGLDVFIFRPSGGALTWADRRFRLLRAVWRDIEQERAFSSLLRSSPKTRANM